MDRFGHQVFSRSAFAEQQYRRSFTRRDLACQCDHFAYGRRFADDLIETESLFLLSPQEMNLTPEFAGLDSVPDGDLKFVEPDWLTDKVIRAPTQRRDSVLEMNIPRDHNDDDPRLAFFVFKQSVESRSVRQINVLQYRQRLFCIEYFHGCRRSPGFEWLITPSA